MRTSTAWIGVAVLVIACGEPATPDAGIDAPALDAPALDGGDIDAGTTDAGTVDAGRDAPSDTATPLSCEVAMRPDLGAEVQNNRGLVVARDGTIYFSQPGAVGRRTPDGTLSVGWLPIAGRLVASVALDATNEVLFVGVPDFDETNAPSVYRVDVATSSITPIANGGSAFGIAVGPDGNVYFTAPADHVSRVAPTGGTVTQVTTAPVLSPSSLAFESDGSLLVGASYMGQIFRITLVDGVESARAMVAFFPSVHGLALDAEGRIYGASNGGGFVGRVAADGTDLESIVMGASAPFGLAFGHGALCGSDLFFNADGLIRRFENDTPGAAVLWH